MTRDNIIRLMQEVDPEMIINLQDHGGNMEDFTGEDPKLLQFWPFKNYVKLAVLVAAEKEQQMIRDGWRKCAEGQRTTQFCGLLDAAVKDEREACAEICRAYAMPDGTSVTAMVLEKAIRARGKT